jgi:hypothetical protein
MVPELFVTGSVLSGYGAIGFFQLSKTRACEPRVLHTTTSTFVPTNAGGRCKQFQVFLLRLNAILATRLRRAGAFSVLSTDASTRNARYSQPSVVVADEGRIFDNLL